MTLRIPQRARLGYPILPDQFNVASGGLYSFSPQTPDAIVMQVLANNNQQLPPDLAAKWAAAGGGSAGAAGSVAQAPAAAVTPSGAPISTQTAAGLRLVNIISLAPNAPGVYQCQMSDGSSHYCDVDGNPISYTPPPAAPAVTPAAASQPTSVVSPSVTPTPAPTPTPVSTPAAVTASGQAISTTTAAPAPAPTSSSSPIDFSGVITWLQGSMFGGIPNWILAGGAALLLMGYEGGNPRSRR